MCCETADRWPLWRTDPLGQAPVTDRELVCFEIEADGFLYNMVRAITGTLVEVGLGKRSPHGMRDLIDDRDRGLAGETAPAHGLYLVRVNYEE